VLEETHAHTHTHTRTHTHILRPMVDGGHTRDTYTHVHTRIHKYIHTSHIHTQVAAKDRASVHSNLTCSPLLQCVVVRCNTLQHIAHHRNTLQQHKSHLKSYQIVLCMPLYRVVYMPESCRTYGLLCLVIYIHTRKYAYSYTSRTDMFRHIYVDR